MRKFLEAISLISWWGWSGKLRHFLSFQKNIMSLGKLVGGIAGLPDEVCPPDNINQYKDVFFGDPFTCPFTQCIILGKAKNFINRWGCGCRLC